jgi:hypothetical protein
MLADTSMPATGMSLVRARCFEASYRRFLDPWPVVLPQTNGLHVYMRHYGSSEGPYDLYD